MTNQALIGNGPNTVSESTVSNTELSEFFGAHWVPGSELSEFLSAYDLCAKKNSPSFSQNSPSLPQSSVSSLFRDSTLQTVFRPFPTSHTTPKIARGKRSHRARNPEKLKVTKKWLWGSTRKHNEKLKSNKKVTKTGEKLLFCYFFSYFFVTFGSTPKLTFSLLFRFSGFQALWDLLPLTTLKITLQTKNYLSARKNCLKWFSGTG